MAAAQEAMKRAASGSGPRQKAPWEQQHAPNAAVLLADSSDHGGGSGGTADGAAGAGDTGAGPPSGGAVQEQGIHRTGPPDGRSRAAAAGRAGADRQSSHPDVEEI